EELNTMVQSGGNSKAMKDFESLEREVIRLRSLLRMTATLNATLNYERVLEMTLDMANSALTEAQDTQLISVLMMFNHEDLYIAAARGLPQADMRVTFPGERGILGESLSTVQTRMSNTPSGDSELKRLTALHNCKLVVCIPLVVGLEIYGVLIFAHAKDGFFTQDRIELLEAISHQAMIALQNARLYQDLEQEKERIGEIQEEARKKLARDLHDGPTQSIGAIAMRVNFARRLLTRDPEQAAGELFQIEELARRTTKEIRQMLFTLRPLILESEGLIPALNQLSEKMRENHNQNVIIEADESVLDDMEVGKLGVIFFIVEEAVNNARKHARAKHIWVRLNRNGDLIHLEIEDDGVGFDLSSIQSNYEQRDSLGMVNLHERAEIVNGILKIDSSPGGGTRISVTVPGTIEAAERLHRPGFVA
ncbi:MAG: GAF domain-containing sensor histidine kinase, partial [Anaerolineales bacterium]